MKNPIEKDKSSLVVPVILGAAVAAGLTWFFLSDETAGLREKLADNAGKSWDSLKEQLPYSAEDLDALKEKVKDTAAAVVNSVKAHAEPTTDPIA